MSAVYRIASLSLVALLLFFVGVVLGQQSAPTDYKLVTENVLAAIDLSKEVESVQGRELRLSSAVIEPGGHVGLHSHRGDPSIVYILSGVLTTTMMTARRKNFTLDKFSVNMDLDLIGLKTKALLLYVL